MDRAVATPSGPRIDGGVLVIQHVVTGVPTAPGDDSDPDRDGGEQVYHLVLSSTEAAVRTGRADRPTVTFTSSYPTASAIASGASNAQAEFMAGNLRIGGAVDQLLPHLGALAEADDVFAPVRATTEY